MVDDTNKAYIKSPSSLDERKRAIKNLNFYNSTYVNSRNQGKPFNLQVFEHISNLLKQKGQQVPEPPQDIICPITQTIFNVPVKVITAIPRANGAIEEHEHFFDFSTLSDFHKANKAAFTKQGIYCTHPINRLPIKSFDLIPAPEIQEKIDHYLTQVKNQLKNIQAAPEITKTLQQLKDYSTSVQEEQPAVEETKQDMLSKLKK